MFHEKKKPSIEENRNSLEYKIFAWSFLYVKLHKNISIYETNSEQCHIRRRLTN